MLYTAFSCTNKKTGETRSWSCNDISLVEGTMRDYAKVVYQYATLCKVPPMQAMSRMIYDALSINSLNDVNNFADKYSQELVRDIFLRLRRASLRHSVTTCFLAYVISRFWAEFYMLYGRDNSTAEKRSIAVLDKLLNDFVANNTYEHTGFMAFSNQIMSNALQISKVRFGLVSALGIFNNKSDLNICIRDKTLLWSIEGTEYDVESLLEDGVVALGVPVECEVYELFKVTRMGTHLLNTVQLTEEEIKEYRDDFKVIEIGLRQLLLKANGVFPELSATIRDMNLSDLIAASKSIMLMDDMLF